MHNESIQGMVGFDEDPNYLKQYQFEIRRNHDMRLLEAAGVESPVFARAYEVLSEIEYQDEVNAILWGEREAEEARKQLEKDKATKVTAKIVQFEKPRRALEAVTELKEMFKLLRLGEIYSLADVGKVIGEEYRLGYGWSSRGSNIISRAIRWAAKEGIQITAIRRVGYRRI